MEDCGTVMELRGHRALIRLDHKKDSHQCRHCGCCAGDAEGHPRLWLDNSLDLRPEERVRVWLETPNPAVASVVVFVPPLAGAILGGGAGKWIGGEGEIAMMLGGAAGIALGFGLVALLARCVPGLGKGTRILGREEDAPHETSRDTDA